MQCTYDGEEVNFDVKSHGNRNKDDGKLYVCTKCNTKIQSSHHLQDNGPKRALFKTLKALVVFPNVKVKDLCHAIHDRCVILRRVQIKNI